MKFEHYATIFGLVLVVLIAGCASHRQSPSYSNDGIVINEFSSADSSLYSGDNTTLYLEIQNKGGVDAKDVKAYLFDIDQWNPTPSAMHKFGDMRAGNENAPGEIKTMSWDITAPELPQGVTNTFPIETRVVYGYKSTASSSIHLYSYYDWKRLSDKGQLSVSSEIPTSNSNGPIQVSLMGSSAYEIRQSGDNSIPVVITFTNIGSGDPVEIENDGTWNKGKMSGELTVLGPAGTKIDCGNGANSQVNFDLNLRRGKPSRKSCIITIPNDATTSLVTLNFNFDYQYFVSRMVQISVTGNSP